MCFEACFFLSNFLPASQRLCLSERRCAAFPSRLSTWPHLHLNFVRLWTNRLNPTLIFFTDEVISSTDELGSSTDELGSSTDELGSSTFWGM